mmetsp:Transcript_50017/g.55794  ORF Transcript_50017/g.55794 Transcript_50017/m.55794 type:complete len:224 (-) Transcript_50017:187-858(-)
MVMNSSVEHNHIGLHLFYDSRQLMQSVIASIGEGNIPSTRFPHNVHLFFDGVLLLMSLDILSEQQAQRGELLKGGGVAEESNRHSRTWSSTSSFGPIPTIIIIMTAIVVRTCCPAGKRKQLTKVGGLPLGKGAFSCGGIHRFPFEGVPWRRVIEYPIFIFLVFVFLLLVFVCVHSSCFACSVPIKCRLVGRTALYYSFRPRAIPNLCAGAQCDGCVSSVHIRR